MRPPPCPLLFLFSVLCLILCASPLCTAAPSPAVSSSASTPPVYTFPASQSSTGRNDVWPPEAPTGGGESQPIPDVTSHLHCEFLDLTPVLAYNQSVLCTIECKSGTSPAAGKVSDYEWSADEIDDLSSLSDVERAQRTAVDWSRHMPRCLECGSSQLGFGSVSNFSTFNESHIITFVYTAPAAGSVGILHVTTGWHGAEIEHSPIVFKLKQAPSNSDNSTSPPVVPPVEPTASTSFFSLSNPAFIAVIAVAGVVFLVALVGGVWASRVFARKAHEVRELRASEAQWAHSVPSLTARLTVPQSSALRSPLLQ